MSSKLLRAGVLLLLSAGLGACTRLDSGTTAVHLGQQVLELGCSRARQLIGQEEFAILHGKLSRSL